MPPICSEELRRNRHPSIASALALSLVTLLCAGCDGDTVREEVKQVVEERIEAATGEKTDIRLDDEGLTLSAGGRSINLTATEPGPVAEMELPDHFPLPPDAQIESFIEGIASETLTLALRGRNVGETAERIGALLEEKGFYEVRLFAAEGMVTARYIAKSGKGSMQLNGYEKSSDNSPTTIATLIFIPTAAHK